MYCWLLKYCIFQSLLASKSCGWWCMIVICDFSIWNCDLKSNIIIDNIDNIDYYGIGFLWQLFCSELYTFVRWILSKNIKFGSIKYASLTPPDWRLNPPVIQKHGLPLILAVLGFTCIMACYRMMIWKTYCKCVSKHQ